MKKVEIQFSYKIYNNIEELSDNDRTLINTAKQASEFAYAPYSNFKVGATILLKNGEIVNGSNQENASFPVGICAERVALANLSLKGHNNIVTAIAVYCNNKNEQMPAAPCGMCRQALYEQEKKQKSPIRILLKGNMDEIIEVNSVNDLLPLGFSENDL
jgi:cytidine deaminase